MIFPIQPPLTERDDKAATVIIAVVYGGPMAQEGAGWLVYRARLFLLCLAPLPPFTRFSSSLAFLFSLPLRREFSLFLARTPSQARVGANAKTFLSLLKSFRRRRPRRDTK